MTAHPREQLMAYADGELDAAAAAAIDRHIEECTECGRELSIVHSLKGAMRDMEPARQIDVWTAVNRRLTRPVGWLLILAGSLVWVVLAVIQWFRNDLTIEWLASTAVITGLILLLVGIGHEQYRQWKLDRYKDVER